MMQPIKIQIAAFAALALIAVGCGDDAADTPEVTVDTSAEFAAGTTMARLADQGNIKVGVKFDQPGLGSRSLETDQPVGFDVEIAKLIAANLGIETSDIEFVETVSADLCCVDTL